MNPTQGQGQCLVPAQYVMELQQLILNTLNVQVFFTLLRVNYNWFIELSPKQLTLQQKIFAYSEI